VAALAYLLHEAGTPAGQQAADTEDSHYPMAVGKFQERRGGSIHVEGGAHRRIRAHARRRRTSTAATESPWADSLGGIRIRTILRPPRGPVSRSLA
jgi:hypothetical protein